MDRPTDGDPSGGLTRTVDDPRRVALGVFVAANLLATTLGAVQLREPIVQRQHDPRRVTLPDTSKGAPRALLSAPQALPTGVRGQRHQFQPGPRNLSRPLDTSRGFGNTIRAQLQTKPVFRPPHLAPIANRTQPADTSRGMPNALRPASGTPFVPQPWLMVPVNEWQALDTSRGTPKTLYEDVSFAPTNLTESIPALHRYSIGEETSAGSPMVLLNATQPIPFIPDGLFVNAPAARWQPLDTSEGTPLAMVPRPFVPALQGRVDSASWVPSDTSAGTPLALRTPSAVPFEPAPHIPAPFAWWAPADTSIASPEALLTATVAAPFVPNPWANVPAAQRQQPDTNTSDLLPLTAKPFFTHVHLAPVRAADVVDTTRAANLPALTFVQAPFEPVQHAAPVRNVSQPLDTSQGVPAPMLALLSIKPFAQYQWPAPIEYRNTWQQQWTFYGQNPDRIPPAVVPPPQAPEAAAGGKHRRKHRYVVEIDGEEFEVSSPERAEELLNQAKALAEERARLVVERAQKATKRPKPKVLADAKKAMPAPEIRASAEIEPYALAVADEIRAIYRDAMRAVEMIALMRRADDDEEESILLLLL